MIKRALAFLTATAMLLLSGCSAVALKQLESASASVKYEAASDTCLDVTPLKNYMPPPVPAEKTSTIYTLSFAGDCTLGGMYEYNGAESSFVSVVGDNYDYPFEYSLPYFGNDDFTMVNLEGVLSDSGSPADKMFRFIGPSRFAKILTAGDIEAVNLANNHTYDFGTEGYNNTMAALDSEGISYLGDEESILYTTDSGLKLGIYTSKFYIDVGAMERDIAALKENGAEIIIVCFHGGDEGVYRPNYDQTYYLRAAIDAGANIVYGHHSHTLQPVEEYNGGVIYYSLGNFAFGGNGNPRDKDSAIIQQKIIRDSDGNIRLGETVLIPFSISSTDGTNDYRPKPYEKGSEGYERCIAKLKGTYEGADIVPNYDNI